MLQIEIDGKQVSVPDGSTVMDAANQAGIYVPHFCYHRKLSIAANCRMCLVEVEKAPKPLPACATPVTDGMKVFTHSEKAVQAQKGVMEFLLINHPLDCPICDQGGECQLQDLAVGYGGSASRYQEEKRVVVNKHLGPVISTDMTRCIHCTRCVRFGQEIAGIMELGMALRGEHTEIMPFISMTVDSEISGNMIDLCPVGALTSKPFRYSARNWELVKRNSISAHDGLGSNLAVQVKQNRVMRVLPKENEGINECWLSDRDRFSYEGLNSEERLTRPMVKQNGQWIECDWQTALEYVANGLRQIRSQHGAEAIGALAAPNSTLEELYLLQKLMRGIGSGNIDHRTRHSDFSADDALQGALWLGRGIDSLNSLDAALVVGSTLRKDHPLLAHRLRQAVKRGMAMHLVNPVDDNLLCKVANKAIVAPGAMVGMMAQIAKAVASMKNVELPAPVRDKVAGVTVSETAGEIAKSMIAGENAAVMLGNMAQHHPDASQLHILGEAIASMTGATLGFLGEAANSVGAAMAGAMPKKGPFGDGAAAGMNAGEMLAHPRKAYLLVNSEVELDSYNPTRALAAMGAADMVVAMSAYKHKAMEYADVMLPISPFSETSGTFVNTGGQAQSFSAVVKPLGETRPAWKVLRVLGNLMELTGFEYDSSEQVRNELLEGREVSAFLNNSLKPMPLKDIRSQNGELERIGEVPIYQSDPVVRRAPALQKTKDALQPAALINRNLMEKLGLREGDVVSVNQDGGSASLRVVLDERLPDGCIRVAAAHAATSGLGGMLDTISVVRP